MNKTKRRILIVLFGIISTAAIMAQSLKADLIQESMEVYEDYGLKFSVADDAFYFNGKIVGYFTDERRGISHINPSGEIYLKANRDAAGNIMNITEMAPEEYAKIIEILVDLAIKNAALEVRKAELAEMKEILNRR